MSFLSLLNRESMCYLLYHGILRQIYCIKCKNTLDCVANEWVAYESELVSHDRGITLLSNSRKRHLVIIFTLLNKTKEYCYTVTCHV